jgi:hypothetical protein
LRSRALQLFPQLTLRLFPVLRRQAAWYFLRLLLLDKLLQLLHSPEPRMLPRFLRWEPPKLLPASRLHMPALRP